jgi:hypothetical protein
MLVLCLLLAALSPFVAFAPFAPTVAHAPAAMMDCVLLNDSASQQLDARCLDGSPPAYYVRRSPLGSADRNKWVVYFQGGGWCYSEADCAGRSQSALGSSKDYPAQRGDPGGILSSDPATNPAFFSWNAVWVAYCDGTSYSGDRTGPVQAGGIPLHYRGQANLKAVAMHLLHHQGMSKSSHVLMDGGSAGGLTVLLHADTFGAMLPAKTQTQFGAIGVYVDRNKDEGATVFLTHCFPL